MNMWMGSIKKEWADLRVACGGTFPSKKKEGGNSEDTRRERGKENLLGKNKKQWE